MMTCPECGQQAKDDAKFCDRCGQGLAKSLAGPPKPALAPLAPGTELKGGYRIVGVMSQSSEENRYSAECVRAGATVRVQLRERQGPESPAVEHSPPPSTEPPVA